MEPLVLALAAVAATGLVATVWLVRRRRNQSTGSGDAFAGMRERAFESLVAEAFQAQGYEPVKAAGDKVAAMAGELMLRRERTTFLVECRYWKAPKVGVDVVHALQRTMAARGASAGFVLSRGRFSREATALAGGCSIRLVDGPALQAMVDRIKAR